MYREHLPSPRLRPWVECLWTNHTVPAVTENRIFPDGCVDILCLRANGVTRIRVVGAMTRVHTVSAPPDTLAVGIRFRPGAARAFLQLPLGEATDRTIPLDDLWSTRASRWAASLSDCSSTAGLLEVLESALDPPEDRTPARRALLALSDSRGLWSPDELARQAGFSPRHFRRLCLDETGLTPKRLGRILRFRHTLAKIRSRHRSGLPIDFAAVAAEAGYYDQAHLIRDFREFAGCAPGALLSCDDR
jgi:AraC-like DNA-binding protein